MALRKPSQKSIDLYNQLVEQQNKIRKTLLVLHKKAEEVVGTGRLPALIVPKRAHKVRMKDFEGLTPAELHRRLKMFWSKQKEKKALFAGQLKGYIQKITKNGYLELWLDQIEEFSGESPSIFGYYDKEGVYHGRMFSKEQIENSPFGKAMEVYNKIFRMSPEVFLAMLYSGRVLSFKWIYRELQDISKGRMDGSWLDQQLGEFNRYGGPKPQSKLLDAVTEAIKEGEVNYKHGPAYKSGGK